jgi:hypothetical protein
MPPTKELDFLNPLIAEELLSLLCSRWVGCLRFCCLFLSPSIIYSSVSSKGGPSSFISLIVSSVASLTGLILSNLHRFSTLRISTLKGRISSFKIAAIEYIASIATFLVVHSLQAMYSIRTGRNLWAKGWKSVSTWKTREITHSSRGVWALN